MKTMLATRFEGFRRAILLAAGVAALTTGRVAATEEEAQSHALKGSWRVTVTTRDCTTGAPGITFKAMLSFAEGGTMSGTTTNPGFQPGQRTGDFGVWKDTGGHTYRALSEAFVLFDSPNLPPPAPVFHQGVQRITQWIRVQGQDSFDSNAAVAFFDTAGNQVFTGCATAVGSRMK